MSLDDIKEPAHVKPFAISTFGNPSYRQPLRLSPAHATFVRDEIRAIKDVGIAYNAHTSWASPCFPVPKPHSTNLKLVINFKGLNMQTLRSSFPLPHIKDVVRKVGKYLCWSKVDLKSGFWQVPIRDEDVLKMGCCTPDELVVWKRLPFGVRNGPPHF